MMDRIVERSAWLGRRAAEARPFSNIGDLAAWIDMEVRGLTKDEAVQLLCAHPELSPPDPSAMTPASQTEQGRLDLLDLDRETAGALVELNRRYTRRHGYPLIIALHEHEDFTGVLSQFERRISADPDEELNRSLGQVVSVMKARLIQLTVKARRHDARAENDDTSASSEGAAQ